MTSFALRNARVPLSLIAHPSEDLEVDAEGLARVDITIDADRIAAVRRPTGIVEPGDRDLDSGQAWPCFADVHTHLDIGHIWTRAPNPDGSFRTAAKAVANDRDANWTGDDLRARMEFGLRCAYAHGTRAIRTHLQSPPGQAETTWGVFRELREEWRGRIDLQGVNPLMVEEFRDGKSDAIVDLVARSGGIVGAVIFMVPDIDDILDDIFRLASERSLDLDLHVDESLDLRDRTLRHVAEAAGRNRFAGRIQCGHCCSLAVQSDADADRTLDLVAEAGIAVVSLPMCNVFLMDREAGRTPRRRGVTLVREMAARGIDVSFASDNCRDPFYGYGDHDMLEVFTQAARIAHIDLPMEDWPRSVTATVDLAAEAVLHDGLKALHPAIPYLSEEHEIAPYEVRRRWSRYWLVDPLDGTKEFVDRTGEFTVNVALIEGGEPVLGAVAAPAAGLLYYARAGEGAWKREGGDPPRRLRSTLSSPSDPLRVVESRSHPSPALEAFLAPLTVVERVKSGSSPKFCVVAEGGADVYPRLGPTMEWDVAAGDC